MTRHILEETHIHPNIRETISTLNEELLQEVKEAIETNDVVVLGMRQNPVPKKARKLLNENKIAFKYLEYGSYLSQWRRRNALKMWTGWPTFPMIFVKGTLIGGAQDLSKLIENGEFAELLKKNEKSK